MRDDSKIRLGAIASFEMGQSPPSVDVVEADVGLPFLQGCAEFGCEYPLPHLSCRRPPKFCREGDVLISVRAPVGTINKADRDYCIGRGLAAIRLSDGYPENYGWHLLGHWASDLRSVAQGTTFEAVGREDLANLQVADIPPEHRGAAVAILDAADDAIAGTGALIAKLKAIKQGLQDDLLMRGLDERGQLRDPGAHPEQFKDSPIGRIPLSWECRRLTELFTLPKGQVSPLAEPYRDWPLVAPDHIESGTGRLLMISTAAEQGAISGKYVFQPGDVVYSKIRPHLRKAWLATMQGLCSADMYPMRPISSMTPRFLLSIILGERFSRFAESVSMRSGFPKINREELSEYLAAVPRPSEQEQTGRVLDGHDVRIDREEAFLLKLRALKKGLMQDLLTGRVRIKVGRLAESSTG